MFVVSYKVCWNDVIKFSCLVDVNLFVILYYLFENNIVILDKNILRMWFRNMLIGGVFIYKCVVNNIFGIVYSKWIVVSVNGK